MCVCVLNKEGREGGWGVREGKAELRERQEAKDRDIGRYRLSRGREKGSTYTLHVLYLV